MINQNIIKLTLGSKRQFISLNPVHPLLGFLLYSLEIRWKSFCSNWNVVDLFYKWDAPRRVVVDSSLLTLPWSRPSSSSTTFSLHDKTILVFCWLVHWWTSTSNVSYEGAWPQKIFGGISPQLPFLRVLPRSIPKGNSLLISYTLGWNLFYFTRNLMKGWKTIFWETWLTIIFNRDTWNAFF